MVEIKKIMEKDEQGIQRQIMPETIPEAIVGLEKYLEGQGQTETGVYSVNGKTGIIILTKEDLLIHDASESSAGLLSSELFLKLKEMLEWYETVGKSLGEANITAEKIGNEGENNGH